MDTAELVGNMASTTSWSNACSTHGITPTTKRRSVPSARGTRENSTHSQAPSRLSAISGTTPTSNASSTNGYARRRSLLNPQRVVIALLSILPISLLINLAYVLKHNLEK
jgi:hypothetical protein